MDRVADPRLNCHMRTRFAPSPTGPLHLGHAYSALLAHDMATAQNGEFLLRIEDIDQSRSRAKWEAQIFDDLQWLGLRWPTPVMRQSERISTFTSSLNTLWKNGFLYPCTCSRADIKAALTAPQEGADLSTGPDGFIYPGTCRHDSQQTNQPYPKNTVLRLNMARAIAACQHDKDSDFTFTETGKSPDGATGTIRFSGKELIETIGDIVLARRDMGTSYHLSVVLDDAAQEITHVTRGEDLFEATKIHVILQRILGLPTPIYHHHSLIRDETGKRLAKRDDARAIAKYRAEGTTPDEVRTLVGL